MENDLQTRVQAVLQRVRPMLQADGGDVEFVKLEDNMVHVRLQGACGTCPMAQMTLKMGIEREIQKEIPEIKGVISV